jgi:hypothetical protein
MSNELGTCDSAFHSGPNHPHLRGGRCLNWRPVSPIDQKVECAICFSEEGSYSCIRPSHKNKERVASPIDERKEFEKAREDYVERWWSQQPAERAVARGAFMAGWQARSALEKETQCRSALRLLLSNRS